MTKLDLGIASFPWSRDCTADLCVQQERPSVVIRAEMQPLVRHGSRDGLPMTHEWTDDLGQSWKRFELPGTVAQGTDQAVAESILIDVLDGSSQPLTMTAQLTKQIPRLPRHLPVSEVFSESDTPIISLFYTDAARAVESMIDSHIDLVATVTEQSRTVDGLRQGTLGAGATTIARTSTIAREWHLAGDSTNPRMSLIVKLAGELGNTLQSVCQNPRRVLRRERQLQRIDRTREIDGGCLRWLARQPGVTVAEKAGSRQECLAVSRVESLDTLENRVVRDLLRRAHFACQKYLIENRPAKSHSRVSLVSKFRTLISRLSNSSPISAVAPQGAVPEPNYVLQMDSRYSSLWNAYLLLVKQQTLEDHVWRWRNRLFGEHVQFAVMSVLQDLCDTELTHGGDVLIRSEQDRGQFLDSRSTLGPWIVSGTPRTSLDLVRGDQLYQHPLIPKNIAPLGPDFVLVRRTRKELHNIFCFWTVMDFREASETAISLASELSTIRSFQGVDAICSGLMIRPRLNGNDSSKSESDAGLTNRISPISNTSSINLRNLSLTLPLQSSFEILKRQIKWGLKLA